MPRRRPAGERLLETEARLRASEDHLRHTVELSPQVAWTCDPQGNVTSYSPRWLEMTGQAPANRTGLAGRRRFPPTTCSIRRPCWRRASPRASQSTSTIASASRPPARTAGCAPAPSPAERGGRDCPLVRGGRKRSRPQARRGAVNLWPTLIDASPLENALLNVCSMRATPCRREGGSRSRPPTAGWTAWPAQRMRCRPADLSPCVSAIPVRACRPMSSREPSSRSSPPSRLVRARGSDFR